MKVNYLIFLEENKDKLPYKLQGVPSIDVDSLSERLNIKVPDALYEFFLIAGDDYDLFLRGGGGSPQSVYAIDKILEVSKSILVENDTSLDFKYFPFLEYTDQFLYVELDKGEDPPVYRFETELYYCGDDYIPGSSEWGLPKGVSKVADSFSGMINDIVKAKLEATQK